MYYSIGTITFAPGWVLSLTKISFFFSFTLFFFLDNLEVFRTEICFEFRKQQKFMVLCLISFLAFERAEIEVSLLLGMSNVFYFSLTPLLIFISRAMAALAVFNHFGETWVLEAIYNNLIIWNRYSQNILIHQFLMYINLGGGGLRETKMDLWFGVLIRIYLIRVVRSAICKPLVTNQALITPLCV